MPQPRLVQEAHAEGSGTTFAVSFAALPEPGRLITVCVSLYGYDSAFLDAVDDNQGNATYLLAGEVGNYATTDGDGASIWYQENIGTPSGTFTITLTPAGVPGTVYVVVTIQEWDGMAQASSLLGATTNSGSNTATLANVTAVAKAPAGVLVLCTAQVARSGDADVAWGATPLEGFASLYRYANYTTINSLAAGYKVVFRPGTQDASWTHDPANGVASDGWGAVIAIFAPKGDPVNYSAFPKPKLALRARGLQ